ncbi:hypothetical protein WJX77_009667 [Trebouxia sp. C0004]
MANSCASDQFAKERDVLYHSHKSRVQDNILQEARSMIQHLKTIKDSEGATQTPDQASKVIERLITAYNRKCHDAARSEKDAQFAAKSLLSYDQLGSQNNWPISHQHPAWKESLQCLSNENAFLRQQLAARADTKFIKGILQHSINNIQLVQVDSRTDLAQRCAELEIEKTKLKEEIFQLRHVLNSQFPGAMTVLFLQNQLAAEIRLREYQAIQRDSVLQELNQQSTAMERLSDVVTGLAEQKHSLQTVVDDKPPSPKQAVSMGTDPPKSPVYLNVPKSPGVSKSPHVSKSHDTPENPDAPKSPTIGSASRAGQQPFGAPRATFDPPLTLQHHAERVQSEVRTHHSPHVHMAGHRSPRNKAAPRHESRVIPSPDRQKSPPAPKVQQTLKRVPWE